MNYLKELNFLYSKYIVRDVIFPKHQNVGLKKSRMRTKYDSYKLFWREKLLDRVSCDDKNRIGVAIEDDFYKTYGQAFSIDAVDTYHVLQESDSRARARIIALSDSPSDYKGFKIRLNTTDGQVYDFIITNSGTTGTQNAAGQYIINLTGLSDSDDIIDEIEDAIVAAVPNTSPSNRTGLSSANSPDPLESLTEDEIFIEYDTVQTYLEDKGRLTIFAGGSTGLSSMAANLSVLSTGRPPEGVLDIVNFAHGGLAYNVIGDLSYIGEKRMEGLITDKRELANSFDFEPSNLTSSSNECFMAPTASVEVSYALDRLEEVKPLHSPQLYHNPDKWYSYQESQGWLNRKTRLRKPFEDTYEKWSEDVKLPGQNYSIVPEFRISEHMDHYVLDNDGDFTVKNHAFLTLRGASPDGEMINDSSEEKIVTSSQVYSYSEAGDQILSYPTSSIEDTGVFNHADGLTINNPIYSPSNSSFVIENSIPSRKILRTLDPISSPTSMDIAYPDNAAGKFNTENQEDFLVVSLDKINHLQDSRSNIRMQSSADNVVNNPFSVSIWAQPTQDGTGSTVGLWSAGENLQENTTNPAMAVFTNFSYQPSADYQPVELGLTIAFSGASSSSSSSPMYGNSFSQTSSVYTFVNNSGEIYPYAKLTTDQMNHILVQVVPATSVDGHKNYILKAWLNGEELYGINILNFHPLRTLNKVYAHSPVPLGGWDRSMNNEVSQTVFGNEVTDNGVPQLYPYPSYDNLNQDLDGAWSAAGGALNGIDTVDSFVIGNCDYHSSVTNSSAAKEDSFVGILDEFCVFTDMIFTNTTAASLYNGGNPRNMREFHTSTAKNSLEDFTYVFSHHMMGTYNITVDADNGEYNTCGLYSDGFSPVGTDYPDYKEEVGKVPNNWVNNHGENSTTASPLGGKLTMSGTMAQAFEPKILTLAGQTTLHSSIEDPPVDSGQWRYVMLDLPFNATSKIEFSVYQGRNIGRYGLDNPPEAADGEQLYLQAQLSGTNVWSTIHTVPVDDSLNADLDGSNNPIPGTGDDAATSTHTVVLGQQYFAQNGVSSSDGSTVKFRWIARTTGSMYDQWGIFDINISTVDSSGKPRTLTFQPTTLAERRLVENNALQSSTSPEVFGFYMRPHLGLRNWDYERQQALLGHLTCYHRIGVPLFAREEAISGFDADFFNNYVFTDTVKYYLDVARDKSNMANIDSTKVINLSVNAVKKLIPYEGFYPQDRTVQISKLFLEKIEKNILNPNTTADSESMFRSQALQAALQHFFAPGILYNSLKSGISVDFPAFTNSSGMEPVTPGNNNYIYSNINPNQTVQLYNDSLVPHWYNESLTSSQITDASIRLSSTAMNPEDHLLGLHSFSRGFEGNRRNVSGFVITSEPSTRIPFEALLDPYKYLLRNSQSSRYNPDNIESIDATYQDYEIKSKPYQYYYMAPTYYDNFVDYDVTDITVPQNNVTVAQINGGKHDKYNFPYFELDDTNNLDHRYEMAINNFLSESVVFFLEDAKLTTVTSKKQRDFKSVKKDGEYYMDVSLKKAKFFNIVKTESTLGVPIATGGRYFGPPSKWTLADLEGSDTKICDPAYAPYTPPYFYGDTTARIKFTAPRTGQPTISEIFSNSVVEDISYDLDATLEAANNALIRKRYISKRVVQQIFGDFKETPAYKSKMPMSSSLDLFGRIRVPLGIYSPDTQNSGRDAEGDSNDKWVIGPKFECPLMNYDHAANLSNQTVLSGYGFDKTEAEGNNSASHLDPSDKSSFVTNPRTGAGLWAAMGEYESSGLAMSIRPTPFTQGTAFGNLADICGFEATDKRIGRVANTREISEAVLMIPISPKLEGERSVTIDGLNLIKVNSNEYQRQKRILESRVTVFDGSEPNSEPIYIDHNGVEVYETTITKMIRAMKKYNIPPRFDFAKYDTQPFAMYFFEFNHTLTRDDLTNIWQGVEPKIATNSGFDSENITHRINQHEFFSDWAGKDLLPDGLKWMVFKVKKTAVHDYGKVTASTLDDDRYQFNFSAGRVTEPDYGYNYPYDFFTMLDKIQVVASVQEEVDPVKFYAARFNRTDDGRNLEGEE